MKNKTTLSARTIYGIVVLLLLLEVVACVHITNLVSFMFTPGVDGLLPSNKEFFSARTERLVWIIGMVVVSVPIFFVLVIKGKTKSSLAKNLLTSGYALFVLFLIIEGALMYFPKSDAIGYRLSHHLWTRNYWNAFTPSFDNRSLPMQLRGKEDYSWTRNSKKKIFIVGDSFCAGDGVPEDKIFSNLIASRLPNCQVVNICDRGADSKKEMENLAVFSQGIGSVLPDVLVWQYYGNDIEDAARKHNIEPVYPPLSGVQNFLAEFLKGKSFFTDFVYWDIISPNNSEEYMSFLHKAYRDEQVIREHLGYIDETLFWCIQNKIPMLVVIFPILGDITLSEELYTRKLTLFLESRGARVIDITPYLKEMPVHNRVVHNSNPHPSEQVHALVAEKLLEVLR